MLVIDTNIWVSYVLMPHSALGLKVKQLISEHPYAFSEDTFVELTDVLMRDKFDRFIAAEKRGEVLKLIASGGEWYRPTETITDCRDPKDNKFLELAIAANATRIVTGDQDLLVLNPYRDIHITPIAQS